MFAVDWAVKKEFQIHHVENGKIEGIKPTIDSLKNFFGKIEEHSSFCIEEGGGDSFKLLAVREGHKVYTIQGREVKIYRESLKLPESDENSARVIGVLAKIHPEKFREFKELDIITAEICVLYRELCRHEKKMVRSKNQLFALKQILELVESKVGKKLIENLEGEIKDEEKTFNSLKNVLTKLMEKHPWGESLLSMQGVGISISAGIIANIKRISRFPNKRSLRRYAGVTSYGNMSFNHDLKRILYFFSDQVVKKNVGSSWRKFYDDRKQYYKEKHSEWSKGKIDGCARRSVKIKFLDDVYELLK